jgi:hypothetical protein
LAPSLREKRSVHQTGVLIYKQLKYSVTDYALTSGGLLLAAMSGICKWCNPIVFAFELTHLGTLVTGKFTTILGFSSSPTTSEHKGTISTHSLLMRVTPYFGKLEGTCADQRLSEVTHG